MTDFVSKQLIRAIQASLQNHGNQLQEINQKIWSNPELAYNEFSAHDNICALFDSLSKQTLSPNYGVRRKTYGLDTSFEIEYKHGNGGRVIVFNAEYDALPGVGHACGHNLIATSSIAAFIATVEAMQKSFSDLPGYTVRLLGTPAEEGGGGKLKLIDAGAYNAVDACLMVHPVTLGHNDASVQGLQTAGPEGFLANNKVRVKFSGTTAHAAGTPWEGVNALDAVVSSYVNVSMLRQQILPTQRVHGIISNGGHRPNVIPNEAVLEYYIRSPDTKTLKPLTDRVINCFEGAAKATGCKVDYEWINNYMELKNNQPICETYAATLNAIGQECALDDRGVKGSLDGASTDMGNVMHVVPGLHALFPIPTEGGAGNHTHGFTSGAGSTEGHKRSLVCATGMAAVACRILADSEFAKSVRVDFEKAR
ncbi:putative amidohydrolase [Talaromyces proteolyticus]|uniref:Peptidase M20 domain-containing protein 2 n=1 Tax=Talaromyces proteolyticus TaxID=1131652 RepID=A0AAD4KT00_9EURO|nr:putative amidohydrolase [Talaromyces proteolyticus]KAH8695285.1 putative amidohydrolase [Talaromyces proteolyticus]